ncbi:MAG: AmmeMemoRadiSam system protein B, partial [Bryobacteraceae bacterium]
MARALPRLRTNLDFMPSPVPDRPGLMIRDPFRYSDTTLIIPPPLVQCLELFDGRRTELDLRAALVNITGDFRVGELVDNLVSTLSEAGFL